MTSSSRPWTITDSTQHRAHRINDYQIPAPPRCTQLCSNTSIHETLRHCGAHVIAKILRPAAPCSGRSRQKLQRSYVPHQHSRPIPSERRQRCLEKLKQLQRARVVYREPTHPGPSHSRLRFFFTFDAAPSFFSGFDFFIAGEPLSLLLGGQFVVLDVLVVKGIGRLAGIA
jgi:hypothetical protein